VKNLTFSFKKISKLILYEDKYILVANKPAGFVIQGGKPEESLWRKLKDFIKIRDEKPGEAFLGVVHRLDKPVSGAVVFAKRSKSAKRLFESFTGGKVEKAYLATVKGILKDEDLWKDFLEWEGKKKIALTYVFPIAHFRGETQLLLYPVTGRKHQLRKVLSNRGFPVIGDKKYGSREKILKGKAILLHSVSISFPHPATQKKAEFYAPPPNYFTWLALDKKQILEFLYRVKNLKEKIDLKGEENVSGKDMDKSRK